MLKVLSLAGYTTRRSACPKTHQKKSQRHSTKSTFTAIRGVLWGSESLGITRIKFSMNITEVYYFRNKYLRKTLTIYIVPDVTYFL